jgi:hypothetical protein
VITGFSADRFMLPSQREVAGSNPVPRQTFPELGSCFFFAGQGQFVQGPPKKDRSLTFSSTQISGVRRSFKNQLKSDEKRIKVGQSVYCLRPACFNIILGLLDQLQDSFRANSVRMYATIAVV